MKALLFDSGPIISMTMNNLLWLLDPLKQRFGGKFLITKEVKNELIDKPLKIKRFAFEAVQIAKLIDNGILEIWAEVAQRKEELLKLANKSFKTKGRWIRIVQDAEIEILALACGLGCNVVIDERTVRLLIENPKSLSSLLERRLHSKVIMNSQNVERFLKEVASVQIIRSVELAAVAFEMGLFNHLVPKIKNGKNVLVDAVMWGMKLHGCAVTQAEINELKKEVLMKL